MTVRPASDVAGEAGSYELSWRSSPYALGLMSVAAVALVLPLLVARPVLLALAVPPLVLLAGRRPVPGAALVRLRMAPPPHVEGVPVPVDVVVEAAAGGPALGPVKVRGRRPVPVPEEHAAPGTARRRVELVPGRWGHVRPGPLVLELSSEDRLRRARLALPLPPLVVLPGVGQPVPAPVPAALLRRLGEHVGRVVGRGSEPIGVRPYVPGDPARDVHPRVTARRGRLHVVQRAAERASDVVVVVDATSDVGPVGGSSLDRAVRGATAVAQGALGRGDRVGLVVMGRRLHWLLPGVGAVQRQRIAAEVLQARVPGEEEVLPSLAVLPVPVLPPAALCLFLTPLLDRRAAEAVGTLVARGHPVVVVDVCVAEPEAPTAFAQLARRLWRLEREAARFRLAERGVLVADWTGADVPLADVLAPLLRRPVAAGRR